MLSSTNSINDVKQYLENGYSYYGFTTDDEMTLAVKRALHDTYLEYMLPVLGETYYGDISAKDRDDLAEIETYLYWAEVNFACAEFLSARAAKEVQCMKSGTSSISVEGYSESQSGKDPGHNTAALAFYNKAKAYMGRAGYTLNRIKRGGGMFPRTYRGAEHGTIWPTF